jgi:hypothetical protein
MDKAIEEVCYFMKNNFIFRLPETLKNTKPKSEIDIHEFANKLYVDPQYAKPKELTSINYATLQGKWDIEDVSEDNSIKIIQRSTGDNIVLSFNSFADKVAFANMLYSVDPLRQIGGGFNLEKYINKNILNQK